MEEGVRMRKAQDESLKTFKAPSIKVEKPKLGNEALAVHKPATDKTPSVAMRIGGDNYILVEYGEPVLDLTYRSRVHALENWLRQNKVKGLIDTIPGVRSLLVQYDSQQLAPADLLNILQTADSELGDTSVLKIRSRIVNLPMAFVQEPQSYILTQKNEMKMSFF